MTEKKLVKKLAEVMMTVKNIPKRGFNSFHKYEYVTEADVNAAIQEELAKRYVVMVPNVKSHSVREHTTSRGNKEYIVTQEIEYTFMDGETGETISFTMFGEGQDAGDKATYKATTGSQKYAIMKFFMIPTGDDPEVDAGVDERNHQATTRKLSDAQVKRLFAIANSAGVSEGQVKQAIVKDYKKVHANELTKQEYDELCNRLERTKNEQSNTDRQAN